VYIANLVLCFLLLFSSSEKEKDQNFGGTGMKSADCVLLLDSNSDRRRHSIISFNAPQKVLLIISVFMYAFSFLHSSPNKRRCLFDRRCCSYEVKNFPSNFRLLIFSFLVALKKTNALQC